MDYADYQAFERDFIDPILAMQDYKAFDREFIAPLLRGKNYRAFEQAMEHPFQRALREGKISEEEFAELKEWARIQKAKGFEYCVEPSVSEDMQSKDALLRLAPVLILIAIGVWRGKDGWWFLLLLFGGLFAAGIAVLHFHKSRMNLRVRIDCLLCGEKEWQWNELTSVEIGAFGVVKLRSLNRTLCRVGMTYTFLPRFLEDVRAHGIPIYVDGEEYTERINNLFL